MGVAVTAVSCVAQESYVTVPNYRPGSPRLRKKLRDELRSRYDLSAIGVIPRRPEKCEAARRSRSVFRVQNHEILVARARDRIYTPRACTQAQTGHTYTPAYTRASERLGCVCLEHGQVRSEFFRTRHWDDFRRRVRIYSRGKAPLSKQRFAKRPSRAVSRSPRLPATLVSQVPKIETLSSSVSHFNNRLNFSDYFVIRITFSKI